MGRQLREISRRRAELVLRAKYERLALAGKRLWLTTLVLITGRMLGSGLIIGSRYSTVLYAAGVILFAAWPKATLRWAGRGLRIWRTVDRIRKNLLR